MLSQLFCVSDVKTERIVDRFLNKIIRRIEKAGKTNYLRLINNLEKKV